MARFGKSLLTRLSSGFALRVVDPSQSRAQIALATAGLGVACSLERFSQPVVTRLKLVHVRARPQRLKRHPVIVSHLSHVACGSAGLASLDKRPEALEMRGVFRQARLPERKRGNRRQHNQQKCHERDFSDH